ncbi:hypothetical protein AJ78_01514 [Emergomyces pasteurianus Ep9510]|uniref:Uncharacterized protein n=1 Tax=Emergomyces pasteurianus Ep9510 TaxID=1447872 RepID=A0A1J9PRB5_9EURO|nr:hypothetical protein AJ78_01514 [Emergomyces pasteurianus Ep9510]
MNLSHLVTSYQNSPSTYPYSGTSQKRHALHSESSSLSVSNGYYDRNASNLAYSPTPQPPLSPPVEEQTRFSLPSISTLLQGADQLPPVHITKKHRPNSLSPIDVDLKSQGHGATQRPMNRPRMILPPTPPLRPGSGLDGSKHSPSGSSQSSAHSPISVANLTNSTISPMDSYERRTSQVPFPSQSTRTSVSQGSPVSITEKHYTTSSKLPPNSAPFASPVEPPANSTDSTISPAAPSSFHNLNMAASSLLPAVKYGSVPAKSRQVHLPDMSQGIFSAIQSANSLTQSYGRETFQMPPCQLWQIV